ncbi:YaeQ family protein [Ketobacter sp. MCCC 1A13808]|uniref:YaeQ family protein n=1 Tax=Ketobacter sp. MCCC 1A13808 TaxID=2602738 RepID=UPI0012EB07B1|nr:YaeQ family protein [Ketobacter sp. MCCC 1A13808]MVF11096.1 YaeQ family protein [Ketobacter sp. MCCC 1A13808]
MALKSTIFKADVQISDMDRNYYHLHGLTLALHPSETEQRMMIRLLAYVLNASESLQFGKGLSNEEDAALWDKDLTGEIKLWIDVGLPDEKRIRKASHRAQQVIIYCYGENTASIWWQQNKAKIKAMHNVTVYRVGESTCDELGSLCQRTMRLYCSIMDTQITLGSDNNSVEVKLEPLS